MKRAIPTLFVLFLLVSCDGAGGSSSPASEQSYSNEQTVAPSEQSVETPVAPREEVAVQEPQRNTFNSSESWSSGRARFTGSRPSNCKTYGTVQIYYDGTNVREVRTEGDVHVWESDGNVCVIFRNPEDVGKHKFLTQGVLQIQNDF